MKQPYLKLLRDEDSTETIDEYIQHKGYSGLKYVQNIKGDQVIDYLKESGLKGKGGAGFPAFIKWNTVKTTEGKSVIVCNAAEGEVGLSKDKELLTKRPHLVLEGILIAAAFLETDDIIIGLKESYRSIKKELEHAINELTQLNEFKKQGSPQIKIKLVSD